MRIEFILTFEEHREQEYKLSNNMTEFAVNEILKNPGTLLGYVWEKFLLDREDIDALVKLSACICYDAWENYNPEESLPQWYKDANGKLFLEKGVIV